jgi:adenylate cyclase
MDSRVNRRLTVIVASDIVGYSLLMGENEAAALSLVQRHRQEVFDPETARFGGRTVKLMGDGALVEFRSVVDAVDAALAIQRRMAELGGPIRLRFGINLGDVIDEGADIYGDGVNVAARLEAVAPVGGICISASVRDCLAADVAAEFADVGSLRLKNIARAVGVYSWPTGATLSPGEEGELPEGASIVAALPFDDLTGDAALKHLSAGLDEDLVAMLSSLDEVRLVSAPPAAQAGSLAQLGRKVGVDWILRGSVRATGDRVRTGVQLIECATDRTVWARRFDGDQSDVFAYQDAVVEEIVSTLQVTVADGEQALVWRAEAGSPEAYQSFLSARASYKEYRRSAMKRAREHYQRAVDANPGFAAAIVGLARTHIEDATWGWSADKQTSCDQARTLLEKAFAIQPDHALACSEMAHLLMVERQFEAGLDWATRATQLAPTWGDAYHVHSTLLCCLSRFEDALHYSRESMRRTPATPDFYFVAMNDAYIGLRRWRHCATLSRKILARRPDWTMTRAALVIALVALGQSHEAAREVEEIQRRSPKFSASDWKRYLFSPDREDVPSLEKMLIDAGLRA